MEEEQRKTGPQQKRSNMRLTRTENQSSVDGHLWSFEQSAGGSLSKKHGFWLLANPAGPPGQDKHGKPKSQDSARRKARQPTENEVQGGQAGQARQTVPSRPRLACCQKSFSACSTCRAYQGPGGHAYFACPAFWFLGIRACPGYPLFLLLSCLACPDLGLSCFGSSPCIACLDVSLGAASGRNRSRPDSATWRKASRS